MIHSINRYQFVTQTSGASLLHLSLDGLTTADDYYFDRRYKYIASNSSYKINYIISFFRYPCLHTVRILLQCGADVNANNTERLTPVHVFVSTSSICDEKILQLLCDNHVHLDYTSELGKTPIDMAFNTNIRQLLKTKMTLNLKCLCAKLIRKEKISVHGRVSKSLISFIQRH